MNVLFIADGFTRGGLETHIIQLCSILRDDGHNTFLATGQFDEDLHPKIFEKFIKNLSFAFDSTPSDIVNTVDEISNFIIANKIEIIHAHPFYSLFVAGIIANRKRLPLICTIHGPLSIHGAPGPNPRELWREMILRSHIIAVSGELSASLHKEYNHWPDVQPNFVETGETILSVGSKTMLWAGRLDSDKCPGLLKLLDLIEAMPEWQLDIAGMGSEYDVVISRISSSPTLHSRVRLLGWITDISSVMRGYEIVAGMGRVVLEASALAIPCLLVGYEVVKGFVTLQMADAAAFTNFSGRITKAENTSTIASTLDAGLYIVNGPEMKLWVLKNRSKAIIGRRYLSILSSAEPFESQGLANFYEKILSASDPKALIWFDEFFQVDNSLLN